MELQHNTCIIRHGNDSKPHLHFSYSVLKTYLWLRHHKRLTYIITSCFFLVSWGGVRLSPLGMSATIWPIVPAPDDRWWMWSIWWNENWQGKTKYSKKTYPIVTLFTTNPTLRHLSSNPVCRGGKSATNLLSYGTAYVIIRNLAELFSACDGIQNRHSGNLVEYAGDFAYSRRHL
jgi:hypothetical protein